MSQQQPIQCLYSAQGEYVCMRKQLGYGQSIFEGFEAQQNVGKSEKPEKSFTSYVEAANTREPFMTVGVPVGRH